MNAQQNSRLTEWIALGKQAGQIREARTVVLAYCMDERAMRPWIVDGVEGRVREEKAQDFMARLIHVGSEGSDGPQSPA